MAPRETENNGYAKFSGDKERALWYVMVFSGEVNTQEKLGTMATQNFGGLTRCVMVYVKMVNNSFKRLTCIVRFTDYTYCFCQLVFFLGKPTVRQ